MTVSEFISRLGPAARPTKTAGGWEARCPAHEDNRSSLSVGEGQDGRVLLHCHAGCSLDQVCAAVGISPADLFRPKPRSNGNGTHVARKLVAAYPYTDEHGKTLFEVCRFDPKDFRQRRPDPNSIDGYTYSVKGVRKPLYRLPAVLKAVSNGFPVVIVEGEKDADALTEWKIAATCNAGGAGKWRPENTQTLASGLVYIIADNDPAGQKHAQKVAAALYGTARAVHVVTLPQKDFSDWKAAGGTLHQLGNILFAANEWTPDQAAPESCSQQFTAEAFQDWDSLAEDAADIAAKILPPRVEVVEGIVCEGSKLIIGSGSKSYKTWLTMDLALSVAHGLPFLDRQTIQSRVLYCNLELKAQTFDFRLQSIAQGKGIQIERSQFVHLPLRGRVANLPLRSIVDSIIQVARARECSFVVVDPLYKVNFAGDENSANAQTMTFNELDRLCAEGFTLILNDHFGKGNQSEKDPLDALRGSSAKGGDVDAAMILRNHEEQHCYVVDMVHRELPPVEPFCIGWDFPRMILRDDLDPDRMKQAGGRPSAITTAKILDAMRDTSENNPVSVSQLAETVQIARQTLSDHLSRLRNRGFVRTVGDGPRARQYLTDEGKQQLKKARSTAGN